MIRYIRWTTAAATVLAVLATGAGCTFDVSEPHRPNVVVVDGRELPREQQLELMGLAEREMQAESNAFEEEAGCSFYFDGAWPTQLACGPTRAPSDLPSQQAQGPPYFVVYELGAPSDGGPVSLGEPATLSFANRDETFWRP